MRLVQVLEALGGLGLFIFGMKTMAGGLQRFAGGKFRRIVEKMTGNRLSATLTGSCLTSLLQSSGAASILIIGFVNAGLLSLYQALGMLVGTGLGTALAIQFIAFKVSLLSLPVIFAGVLLKFFNKRRRLVSLGEILLGFGLLFFGLEIMESRFASFGGSVLANSYQSLVQEWLVVSVFIGALLTFLVQSGSAAIGIIIALAGGRIIGFDQAVAMTVGEVLGTVALAGMGVIGGTITAKRTVIFYGGMVVVAIGLVLLFFPWYLRILSWMTVWSAASPFPVGRVAGYEMSGTELARALANGYSLFVIFLTVLFLPCIGLFARAARKLYDGSIDASSSEPRSQFLDFRVVNTPSLALLQAGSELKRMAQVAHAMVSDTISQFYEYSSKRATLITQKEGLLDVVQKELSSYLVALARQPLAAEVSAEIPVLLGAVNSVEGIGDSCVIVVECMRRKKEEQVFFSEAAMDELKALAAQASYLTAVAVECLDGVDFPDGQTIYGRHSDLTMAAQELKTKHLSRLSNGACTVLAGLLFMDIVAAFVRMGDHALAIIETGRILRP
jgi:phosphate:Na+ symporter